MHLLLVDESNKGHMPNKFFILGGLVFSEEQVTKVDAAIKARRHEFGFEDGDSFKFDTNSRPPQVTIPQHREAKRATISDLKRIGVRLITTVCLHDLAGNNPDQTMEFGLNNVAASYHRLLTQENTVGYMLMDRDNDRYDYLERFHQHGFKYKNSEKAVQDRILLFGMTSDNASHLGSATDIALGAFRYCVNAAGGEGRDEIAKTMFQDLADLMWGELDASGTKQVGNRGYIPSPEVSNIRVLKYREKYERLGNALERYALDELDEKPAAS
jgi:hypothetical protein